MQEKNDDRIQNGVTSQRAVAIEYIHEISCQMLFFISIAKKNQIFLDLFKQCQRKSRPTQRFFSLFSSK